MSEPNRRLLILDDEPALHEQLRAILAARAPSEAPLGSLAERLGDAAVDRAWADPDALPPGALDPGLLVEAAVQELFGEGEPWRSDAGRYAIDSAFRVSQALERIGQREAAGAPYAVAFLAARLLGGWNGREALRSLRQLQPSLEVILMVEAADDGWHEIAESPELSDRCLVLKQPCFPVEVRQFVGALAAKWNLAQAPGRAPAGIDPAPIDFLLEDLEDLREELQASLRPAPAVDRLDRVSSSLSGN